ncbi:hypothetical protein Tco_0916176 [Tanacetum coccineum]
MEAYWTKLIKGCYEALRGTNENQGLRLICLENTLTPPHRRNTSLHPSHSINSDRIYSLEASSFRSKVVTLDSDTHTRAYTNSVAHAIALVLVGSFAEKVTTDSLSSETRVDWRAMKKHDAGRSSVSYGRLLAPDIVLRQYFSSKREGDSACWEIRSLQMEQVEHVGGVVSVELYRLVAGAADERRSEVLERTHSTECIFYQESVYMILSVRGTDSQRHRILLADQWSTVYGLFSQGMEHTRWRSVEGAWVSRWRYRMTWEKGEDVHWRSKV